MICSIYNNTNKLQVHPENIKIRTLIHFYLKIYTIYENYWKLLKVTSCIVYKKNSTIIITLQKNVAKKRKISICFENVNNSRNTNNFFKFLFSYFSYFFDDSLKYLKKFLPQFCPRIELCTKKYLVKLKKFVTTYKNTLKINICHIL